MSPSNRFRFLLIKWVIVLAASVALVIGFWPELLPLGVFVSVSYTHLTLPTILLV